jgi:hypothetical protein
MVSPNYLGVLPTSSWDITFAYAINNAGQITGSYEVNAEQQVWHVFIWTPAP